MSSGPIEFMGESSAHTVPESEYGGRDGLIQPGPDEVGLVGPDGMLIGHNLNASEASGAMSRHAHEPVYHKSGEDPVEVGVFDPVSGREVVESGAPEGGAENASVEGKWGKDHGLSDLKP